MPSRPPVHRPHGAATRVEQRQSYDKWRGSASERGYGSAWKRTRDAFISAHPLCADCLVKGMLTPATEVHHTVEVSERPDLMHEMSLLKSTCHSCHMLEHAQRRRS